MTKAPIDPQEPRRRMYRRAKSDKQHRFCCIFVHVTRIEVLQKGYLQAKKNGDAHGRAPRSFTEDEGWPLRAALQGEALNYPKLPQ